MWLPSTQGTAYYVQVSAYNMKGWGPPQASVPPFAIPSSKYQWECWHELAPAAGWMGGGGSSLCRPGVPLPAGMESSVPEAAFGVSGQAGRLCLGVRDAASSQQELCHTLIFQPEILVVAW